MYPREVLRSRVALLLLTWAALSVIPPMVSRAAPARDHVVTPARIDPHELTMLLDTLLPQQLAERNIPGASVALITGGQLRVARGYGYADLERRIPVAADQTLFRVGSVSKLFTWVAVMQLVEQGRLDLHADVNTYLTGFQIPATYPQPITLAHLMTHTAGFEDRQLGITAATMEDLLPLGAYLAAAMPPRIYPPGAITAYSNYGAALAGYLVEVVAGEPFGQYVQRNILAPLKMEHSSFAQPLPPSLGANLATSYRYDTTYHAMPFEYFQIAPAAALSTTATDMARFMLAQLHGEGPDTARILQEQSLADMQRRQFANDPRVNGVTFGFAEMRLNGQRLIVHSGTTNDERFRSLLALVPDQGIGLFVSYSGEGGGDAKWELLQAVLDQLVPAARPDLVTPPADFAARAHQYAGSYQSTRSVATTVEKIGALLAPAVTVQVEDNALLISGLSREPTRWVELEPRVFRQIHGEERLVFRADTQGRITHLFQDNLPIVGFQRLAWYESLGLHYTILGGCAALFLTTLVGALVGWLRNRREHAPIRRPALLAHRLGWLVSAMYLIFLVLFVASMSDLTRFPTPLTLAALTIALGASMLVVAMGGFAIVAWRRCYWSLFGRLHYSVLTLGTLAFVWWLGHWNMLGYRL